jgi:hypothetical protein
MKKIFLLSSLFLCSCEGEYESERKLELTSSPHIVIDMKEHYYPQYELSPPHTIYNIKVYNGNDVEWFEVSNTDYKKLEIKDTLINFMIEK